MCVLQTDNGLFQPNGICSAALSPGDGLCSVAVLGLRSRMRSSVVGMECNLALPGRAGGGVGAKYALVALRRLDGLCGCWPAAVHRHRDGKGSLNNRHEQSTACEHALAAELCCGARERSPRELSVRTPLVRSLHAELLPR